MLRMLRVRQVTRARREQQPLDRQCQRRHDDEVARDGRDLRAHEARHRRHEAVQPPSRVRAGEPCRQRRGGRRRLLGGQRPVQQVDRDEGQRIVQRRLQPLDGQRRAVARDHELHEHGDRGDGAADRRRPQHRTVLARVAGEVVLAGAARRLHDTARQQPAVLAQQQPHALLAGVRVGQAHDEARDRAVTRGGGHAELQQPLHPLQHQPRALQRVDEVQRDAVLLQMAHRVGDRRAALDDGAFEPRAGRHAFGGCGRRVHPRVDRMREVGERQVARAHRRHALPHAPRKADGLRVGGQHEQCILHVADLRARRHAVVVAFLEQLDDRLAHRRRQRGEPVGIARAWEHAREDRRQVGRGRRRRQELLGDAAAQLLQESMRARQPDLAQQRHGRHVAERPRERARHRAARLRIALQHLQQEAQPRLRVAGRVVAVRRLDPAHRRLEPRQPHCQRRVRIGAADDPVEPRGPRRLHPRGRSVAGP